MKDMQQGTQHKTGDKHSIECLTRPLTRPNWAWHLKP